MHDLCGLLKGGILLASPPLDIYTNGRIGNQWSGLSSFKLKRIINTPALWFYWACSLFRLYMQLFSATNLY